MRAMIITGIFLAVLTGCSHKTKRTINLECKQIMDDPGFVCRPEVG